MSYQPSSKEVTISESTHHATLGDPVYSQVSLSGNSRLPSVEDSEKQKEEPKGDVMVFSRRGDPSRSSLSLFSNIANNNEENNNNNNREGVTSMEHDKIIERVMTLVPQAQGMSPGEILALSKREGGGFGEGGNGMFFLLFLLLLLGRGGNGLFGAGDAAAAGLTVADLQNINTQIAALQTGQNAGFSGLADRLCAVNGAISQSKFDLSTQLSALGTQLQACCCNIERSIDAVNRNVDASTSAVKETINGAYNALQAQATQNQFTNIQEFSSIKTQMAADKCDTLRAIHDSEQAIINKLNADNLARLIEENNSLKTVISQANQTAELKAYIETACGKKVS